MRNKFISICLSQCLSDAFLTAEYKRYIREHVEQVIDHAKRNGWYDRLMFLTPIDEPKTAEQYEAVRRWAAAIRAADPNVPITVTEQPSPENPAWGTLVGHVNASTVNGNYLFDEAAAVAARTRAGELITWFIGAGKYSMNGASDLTL